MIFEAEAASFKDLDAELALSAETHALIQFIYAEALYNFKGDTDLVFGFTNPVITLK